MRQSLLLIFLLSVTGLMSQTVTIFPKSEFYCYGGRATFNVFIIPDTTDYTLEWFRNGQPLNLEDTVNLTHTVENITFADTGYYTVSMITSYGTINSDTAYLHLNPSLTIDTLYRYNKLGCPGTCKGQMKVHVSGGNPPYTYNWGGGIAQDTIVTSLCKGDYLLTVYDSDSSHCISREYTIEVLTLPKIDFITDPPDTVFLTNPELTAAFPDTSVQHLSNWEWTFFEGVNDSVQVPSLNPVQHIYSKTGKFPIKLHYTDTEGCDTTVQDSIPVMIAELKIYDVFTPNKDIDKKNETFVIQVKDVGNKTISDVYISNELLVLNRWGRVVYNKKNYVSDETTGEWDGEGLSDGVYFYIFTGHGYYGDDVWKGSVTIIGTGKKD